MSLSGQDFSTTDPKKIAQQNRQWGMATGQGLMDQSGAQATIAGQRSDQTNSQIQNLLDPSGTMSRLDQWMTPLANGQGGYNADELSQIRMTPQQQQDIVTGAGISAGLSNAAATGAASRAAAAAGGNPMALATYRARAAQQQGANAADAMTQARIGASNAAAGRAQTIGNTRLGQQQQGLGYYQGLQSQGSNYLSGLQGQQAAQQESALGRQQQAYGTATGTAANAGGLAQSASQNPTTFDKVMGGVSGALSFLEDGAVMPGKKPAVVGENGPERVVSTNRDYMGTGGVVPSLFSKVPTPAAPDLGTTAPQADGSLMFTPGADSVGRPPSLYDNVPPPQSQPLDQGTTTTQADGSLMFKPGADSISLGSKPQPTGFAGFMSRLKNNLQGQQQQRATPESFMPRNQGPSPMNSAKTMGAGVGALLGALEDGAVMPKQGANGIFTKATLVNLMPGEAVVPLSYRANAKVRPSAAVSLPSAPVSYRSR